MKLIHVQLCGMLLFTVAATVLLVERVGEGWGWFVWAAILCIPGCIT